MRWNELLHLRRSFFLGMFTLLISATLGCGGKGTVKGTVTIDGSPLPAGRIAFIPSKGVAASGEIKDGQYTVTGVPSGDAKVTVETTTIKERIASLNLPPKTSLSGMRPPPGAQMPDNVKKDLEEEQKINEKNLQELKALQAVYRPIPDKYSKPETSGLTFTVKSGSNTFAVPLTSK